MTTKCKRPENMKFGMGKGPDAIRLRDQPLQLHAFGLPDGVTINLVKCEDDLLNKPPCFGYSAPAIDPCTGEQAVLSAESPTAVLNAQGTYKMEFVGADPADLPEVGVFCYELAGDVSLLLKKADAPAAPLTPRTDAEIKAIAEACVEPVAARLDALEPTVANNAECVAEIEATKGETPAPTE